MRILLISLILILAVSTGYAQTPENMKLRVKMIDAEGKRGFLTVAQTGGTVSSSGRPGISAITSGDCPNAGQEALLP